MAISVGEVEATLRLKDEMSLQVAKAMVAFKAAMDQASTAAKSAAPAIKSVSDQLDKLGDTLQKNGRAMSDAGMGLTKALTVPITLLGGGAIKAAIDFESSFASVRKTMKATESEFAAMSDGIRELAKALPIGVNELNRLGMMAGQLGISKEHIVGFVEVAAKLGSVTTMSADDAANGLARLRNIMGSSELDIGKMGAALVALGNAGASSEQEILDMSLRIAAAGRALHMSEGDVMGFSNALSSVGIHAEMGGSAMSRLMLRMSEAVRVGGDALEKFATVSRMSAADFAAAFNKDAAQAIIAFAAGMRKSGDEGVNLLSTMADLDVKEVRMRQTLLGLAAASDQLAGSVGLGNKAFQEGTALNKAFEERMKTTAAQLKVMFNNLYDVGIELGTAFLPIMKDAIRLAGNLVDPLKDMAKWFAALPEPIRATALGLGLFAAGAGPALWFAGQLVTSIGALVKLFALLKSEEAIGGAVSALPRLGGALSGVEAVLAASPFLRMLLFGGMAGLVIGAGIAVAANQAESLQADLQRINNDRMKGGATGGAVVTTGMTDGQGKPLITQAQVTEHQANAMKDFNGYTVDAIKSLQGLKVAETAVVKTTFGFADQLKEANKQLAAMSPSLKHDLTAAIQSGAFDMDKLREKTGLSEIALKLFEERVKGADKSLKTDLTESLKVAETRMDAFAAAAVKSKESVEASMSWIKPHFKEGTNQLDVSATFGGATPGDNITQTQFKATSNLFGALPKLPTSTTGGVRGETGVFDNIGASAASSALRAIQGGGNVAASVAGSIGQTLGNNLVSKFGEKIATKFGPMLGGAMNAAIPIAGALIGPGIELLMKLFGDHAGKDLKKMGTQMGVDLSDGLIEAMKADAKKFGGEVQGMLLNISGVIKESGGVAAFGVDQAIAKTNDLFTIMESGTENLRKRAGAEFERVFGQILPEAIDKTTGLAKASFLELIQLSKDFGLSSKAATDFIVGQSNNVASGLNKISHGVIGVWNDWLKNNNEFGDSLVTAREKVDMLKAKIADLNAKDTPWSEKDKANLKLWTRQLADAQTEVKRLEGLFDSSSAGFDAFSKGGQDAFDRVGRLANVTFMSLVGSGHTLLETLNLMAPTLDTMSQAASTFGFTSNGAVAELMKLHDFAKDHQDVIDTLDGLNQMMSGLYNTGLLTQETFSDLALTAGETFQKMVDGGLTSNQAMALMQPTLQTIWELQKRNGFTVDENTQKLIDQAVEAGLVGEAHKSASERMVDALDKVVTVLEAMATFMGVTLPGAARDGAKGVDDAFANMHPSIKVKVNYEGDVPDNSIGMASGGAGRTNGPTWFYSAGNEDFAFSGEGSGFGGGGGDGGALLDEVAGMREDISDLRRDFLFSIPNALAKATAVAFVKAGK